MTKKWIKRGLVGLGIFVVVGGLLFGKDMASYVVSSLNIARDTVKDSVPIEFELRRAQDLLDEILPEIHANIRLIAQEEVELASLKREIAESQNALEQQKNRVGKLRNTLDVQQTSYQFAGRNYSRQEVTDELATQFDHLREAEMVMASRIKLYDTREKSLHAAMQMLEKTRAQKRILAARIENLESRHRLQKAAAIGSGIQLDNSKLAQTERLLGQIHKRLDVAERVLTHESKFVQAIPVDTVSETELVATVDEYLQNGPRQSDSEAIQLVKVD